jgi:hypothetical protein
MLDEMKKQTTLEEWQLQDAEALRHLFEARTEKTGEGRLISQMDFGAKYGIGSQGMVWQYLRGHRPLNIKAAVSFARGLGVKVSDFSETLGRQIEDAFQADGNGPVLKVVENGEARRLQWVTDEEADLLGSFRACGEMARAQARVYVDALPKEISRADLRDNG